MIVKVDEDISRNRLRGHAVPAAPSQDSAEDGGNAFEVALGRSGAVSSAGDDAGVAIAINDDLLESRGAVEGAGPRSDAVPSEQRNGEGGRPSPEGGIDAATGAADDGGEVVMVVEEILPASHVESHLADDGEVVRFDVCPGTTFDLTDSSANGTLAAGNETLAPANATLAAGNETLPTGNETLVLANDTSANETLAAASDTADRLLYQASYAEEILSPSSPSPLVLWTPLHNPVVLSCIDDGDDSAGCAFVGGRCTSSWRTTTARRTRATTRTASRWPG